MRLTSELSNLRLCFPEGFDTGEQNKIGTNDLRAILTSLCLTNGHVVLTDTQLVDNQRIMPLVASQGFEELQKNTRVDGMPPVVASTRSEKSFDQILEEGMLLRKDGPMQFSSLSFPVQNRINKLYDMGQLDLESFYDTTWDLMKVDFRSHIARLNELFPVSGSARTLWDNQAMKASDYPNLAESQLKYLESISHESISLICRSLSEAIEREKKRIGAPLTRTNYWNVLATLPLPSARVYDAIRWWAFDRTYNSNFAGRHGLRSSSSGEARQSYFTELEIPLESLTKEKCERQPQELQDVEPVSPYEFPLSLLRAIRDDQAFVDSLGAIRDAEEKGSTSEKNAATERHMQLLTKAITRNASDDLRKKILLPKYKVVSKIVTHRIFWAPRLALDFAPLALELLARTICAASGHPESLTLINNVALTLSAIDVSTTVVEGLFTEVLLEPSPPFKAFIHDLRKLV